MQTIIDMHLLMPSERAYKIKRHDDDDFDLRLK